ncbi:MAG TPA: YHYH protein [Candidatus Melainabacteria bacterium]|nr:YHYH protein [Candidatus Melainabacteria bacterium]
MPKRCFLFLALYVMLSTCMPVSAHPATNRFGKAAANPWKLLAAAYSPACSASAKVNFSCAGGYRIITANGIPGHATLNSNSIASKSYYFRTKLQPRENYWLTPLGNFPFGIALNGIPFDPNAEECFLSDRNSGWHYEPMVSDAKSGIDENNAHVHMNGAYHYHGLPTGLLAKKQSATRPTLLGYAADGFPIYSPTGFASKRGGRLRSSYRIKTGLRQASQPGINPGGKYDGSFSQDYEFVRGFGDLDECNGKFAVTKEYPRGTYLYVITDSYPYIPRSFRGVPDESFIVRGGQLKPRSEEQIHSQPAPSEVIASRDFAVQAALEFRNAGTAGPHPHHRPAFPDQWQALRNLSSY